MERRLAPGHPAAVWCAQERAASTRSRARGRTAIVLMENRPPPLAESRLGRPRLAAWHDPRRLVSPAYAPNTKRNEGLGRWARREVTPHQQRTTLATLREDIQEHVETLRQQPNLVLRQLGSLCVAQTSEDQALVCAA